MADNLSSPRLYVWAGDGPDTLAAARELVRSLRLHLGADHVAVSDALDPAGHTADVDDELRGGEALIVVLGSDPARSDARAPAALAGIEHVIVKALADDRVGILPVLVGEAEMPQANDLPPELAPFAELRPLRLVDAWRDDTVPAVLAALERAARLAAMLREARLAIEAGQPEHAVRCADGVLYHDPGEVRALRLRTRALALAQRRHLERAALDTATLVRAALDAGDCDAARRRLETWPPGVLDAERGALGAALQVAVLAREREEVRRLAERSTELYDLPLGGPSLPGLPPDATPRPTRAVDENVQFTVLRRSAIKPERWYPMLVFAHLSERRPDAPPDEPDPMAEVQAQANQVLGDDLGAFRFSTEDSGHPVAREGELRIVPRMEGVTFNPSERRFLWTESVHREDFRLCADATLDGRTARGVVTVFAGNLILADIQISIKVNREAAEGPPEPAHAHAYRRIFASYSHQDTSIVEEFEAHAAATGDKYLRDVVTLRAGEVWDQRLRDLIRQADVFQLFWSWNALASPFVREEWQHAVALNRPHFVRPVYWEEPLPAGAGLPPESLRRLHFQRVYPRSATRGTTAGVTPPFAPPPPPRPAAEPRDRGTGAIRLPPQWHHAPRSPAASHGTSDMQPNAPAGGRLVPSGQPPLAPNAMLRVVRYGSVAAACVLAAGLYVVALRNEDAAFIEPAGGQVELPSQAPESGGGPHASPPVDSTAPAAGPPAGGGTAADPAIARKEAPRRVALERERQRRTAEEREREAQRRAALERERQRRTAQEREREAERPPTGVIPPPARPAPDPITESSERKGVEPADRPARSSPGFHPAPMAEGDRASRDVQATLREYETAWLTRDIDRLRRVWPSLPDAEARALEAVSRSGAAVRVSVQVADVSFPSATRAVVRARETIEVMPRGSIRPRQSNHDRVFHLERSGGEWVIVAKAG